MYDYKDLPDEQLVKANIPKFEATGTFEMTDEDRGKAGADLRRLIKEFEKNRKCV